VALANPAAAAATAEPVSIRDRSEGPPASRPKAVSGADRVPAQLSAELFTGPRAALSTLSMSASDFDEEPLVRLGDADSTGPVSTTERD
jgi:hypothetical protein